MKTPAKAPVKSWGRKPKLTWLPVARLKIDVSYQRGVGTRASKNLLDRIANDFRWERFNVITAVAAGPHGPLGGARGANRSWYVVDGQHRVQACRRLGIAEVPAAVVVSAPPAEAAAHFVAVNRDRVAVNALQIHHAMLAAGDERALRLKRVMDKAGVSVPRNHVGHTQLKPGQTLAIGAIDKLVADRGPDGAVAVLSALAQAYAGKVACIRAGYIAAASALLAGAVGEPPTADRVTEVLRRVPQREIDSMARAEVDEHGRTRQAALTVVLNRLAAGGDASADDVVRFLQSRDLAVRRDAERLEPPRWHVGDLVMELDAMVAYANVLRRALGQTVFMIGDDR